jgi:hypothetical protein
MTSCDFVVQDLDTAASLAGPHTIVGITCKLRANEASGITGELSGHLGFLPRRVIRSGHLLLVEPERFFGNLEHQNLNGRVDRLEVTIAGPPFFNLSEGPSVVINVLLYDGNPQSHSFSLASTSLSCDANARTLRGVGDSVGPGREGTYILTIGRVGHQVVVLPQL